VYLVVHVYIVIVSFTNCSIHIFSSSAASMFNKVSVQCSTHVRYTTE